MENARSEQTAGDEARDGARPKVVSSADGHKVSYVEYGASDGTPLVFLHGTPGSRLLGELFDEKATQYDVRVLALDRPGYGHSPPWPDRTLTDSGALVVAVLDDAGLSQAGVVGFSGGGPHALAVAATHGERVRDVDVVAGAVPPSLRTRVPTAVRLFELLSENTPTLLKGALRAQAWVADRASPSLVVSQYTTPEGREDLSAETAELVRRDFVEALARHRSGFVIDSRLLARDWGFSLDDIDEEVRLWHGERDTNVSVADARKVEKRLPNGRMTVFEETDHLQTVLRSREPVLERYGSGSNPSP